MQFQLITGNTLRSLFCKPGQLVRLYTGWRRFRLGYCPVCNDDASAVDECELCNWLRVHFQSPENLPKDVHEFKRVLWSRFTYWLRECDAIAIQRRKTGVVYRMPQTVGMFTE